MKKISGDEETVRVPQSGLANHFGKAVADGLGALTAPGPVTVRIHAPVDIGNVDKLHKALLKMRCGYAGSSFCTVYPHRFLRIRNVSEARYGSDYLIYSSQLPTVLGNGITSRMLPMPVKYMTQRSKPRPKPEWRAEPYLRRSR